MTVDNPTLEDMIRAYLLLNHYDGLCNLEQECGCGLNDLRPCGYGDFDGCRAAYCDKNGFYCITPPSEGAANAAI